MDSPLVVVFLAAIAVTALLQAAFVGALAFGARLGTQKLATLEKAFEETVAPQVRRARTLTEKAAEAAHESLVQAHRVDRLLAEATRKAERSIDRAAARVEGAVERTAERVEAEVARCAAQARQHRILRRLSTASALVVGLKRALEVWQASAADVAATDTAAEVEVGGAGP